MIRADDTGLPSIAIVIVNFNAGSLLRLTVDSISGVEDDSFQLERVVVVDNASTDDSSIGLEHSGVPVTQIRNQSNVGFAAACNQGASRCTAQYLLFLNPDVRLTPHAISAALGFMEEPTNSTTGILGIRLMDDQGRVMRTCARFPKPHLILLRMVGLDRIVPKLVPPHFMTEWNHSTNRVVDQVPGAFYLVRHSLFVRLGGFDSRFFVYYEDVDFALRAKFIGANTVYLATVCANHTGQGTSRKVVAKRLVYSFDSKVRFSYKHFGRAWGSLILVGTLILEPMARILWAAGRGEWRELSATSRATAHFWAHARQLLAEGLI